MPSYKVCTSGEEKICGVDGENEMFKHFFNTHQVTFNSLMGPTCLLILNISWASLMLSRTSSMVYLSSWLFLLH